MRVSDMLREGVVLDVKGAKVVYNSQLLTVSDLEALDAVAEGPDAFHQALDLMAKVIAEWDLEDDAGAIPVTSEGMRRLPAVVATAILEAISENVLPSRAEGEDSGGASSTQDSDSSLQAQRSPNGTESSRPLVTSGSLLGNLPASPPAG